MKPICDVIGEVEAEYGKPTERIWLQEDANVLVEFVRFDNDCALLVRDKRTQQESLFFRGTLMRWFHVAMTGHAPWLDIPYAPKST